jgi:hypothetical protein
MKFIVAYLLSILLLVTFVDDKKIKQENKGTLLVLTITPAINTLLAVICIGEYINTQLYGKQ